MFKSTIFSFEWGFERGAFGIYEKVAETPDLQPKHDAMYFESFSKV